ncbi:MAG: transglutaminase-like domain-containing protein [Promethearchaeota archaeon]
MGISKLTRTSLILFLVSSTMVNGFIGIFAMVTRGSAYSYYGPPEIINFGRNTTYQYNFSYDISRTVVGTVSYERWLAIPTNRTFLTPGGELLQQEFKVTSETFGSYNSKQNITDEHGNLIKYFDITLSGVSSWHYSIGGNFTLRDIDWVFNASSSFSDYNVADPIYMRYTQEEEYINKSHPLIQAQVSTLNNTDNPFTTARNVYDYVTGLLVYKSEPDEYGAEWAIEHEEGDCTEFSFLMVAMLRACGIPARPLRGLVIATSSAQGVSPNFGARVGTSWNFHASYSYNVLISNTIPGHSWLEYFIPGYGWIIADPTWYNSADYSKNIDNIHVPDCVGTWIGSGISPSFGPSVPYFPIVINPNVDQTYTHKFTVLSQEGPPSPFDAIVEWIMENPMVTLAIVVGIVATMGITVLIKKRKNSEPSSYSGRERVFY